MGYPLAKIYNHESWIVPKLLLYTLVLGSLLFFTSCQPSSAGSSNAIPRLQSSEPLIEQTYPGSYDDSFRSATDRFIPQYEWRWLKAQCYQESLLNPRAVSNAGAMGLCQFMPRTWAEMSQRIGVNASVYNPKANATVAAYYMGRLDAEWTKPRPRLDRLKFAQASYNAGLGNVLKAQKACGNRNLWLQVEPCIPFEETKIYIKKIVFYYNDMR